MRPASRVHEEKRKAAPYRVPSRVTGNLGSPATAHAPRSSFTSCGPSMSCKLSAMQGLAVADRRVGRAYQKAMRRREHEAGPDQSPAAEWTVAALRRDERNRKPPVFCIRNLATDDSTLRTDDSTPVCRFGSCSTQRRCLPSPAAESRRPYTLGCRGLSAPGSPNRRLKPHQQRE